MAGPITGILGMNIGDGAGGKVALSIETRILRILSDAKLSYYAATIANPSEIKSGTVWYRVPEILKTNDYGDGTNEPDTPQVGDVAVEINKRLSVKWEYETFDVERMLDSDAVIAMISSSQAIAIENTLNSEFLTFLKNAFDRESTQDNPNPFKDQTITLNTLADADLVNKLTADNLKTMGEMCFIDYAKVEGVFNKIAKTFNNTIAGIPKADIISFVALEIDTNLRTAFRYQSYPLAEWQISKTLAGKQIGNWKYWTDNQLLNKIAANQSYSHKAYDFSNYAGFILHNEAVAFPINYRNTTFVIDPQTANPRFITKIQFGVGFLRPTLVYAILPPAAANAKTKQVNA